MKLLVLAVGHKMPDWVSAGVQTYEKRMPPDARMELVEIRPEQRSESRTLAQTLEAEGKRILRALPGGARLVVLDERGESWSTLRLAAFLNQCMQAAGQATFVIGGADGLASEVKERADHAVSVSKLTLPHGLVRILLAEQLYRAVSILKHHPYHRE